eukprot:6342761-Lingulodinium_polyedra.AAC.1
MLACRALSNTLLAARNARALETCRTNLYGCPRFGIHPFGCSRRQQMPQTRTQCVVGNCSNQCRYTWHV